MYYIPIPQNLVPPSLISRAPNVSSAFVYSIVECNVDRMAVSCDAANVLGGRTDVGIASLRSMDGALRGERLDDNCSAKLESQQSATIGRSNECCPIR